MLDYKYIVVGSGFFGATIAERIANVLNEKVLVLEKREHLGGNSYSEAGPATGIDCHMYGSHIFHTTRKNVWDYINNFAEFNSYRHKVLTKHKGSVYYMPINLETINNFFNKQFNPLEAKQFIKTEVEKANVIGINNFEDKAISMVGSELYEAFINNYSKKQWNVALTELPASIVNRIPVRYSYLTDYFDDQYQGIPLEGYNSLFKKMLDNRLIETYLNTDFFEIKEKIPDTSIVFYTGPIDRYYNYKFGRLKWRSLRFEKEVINCEDFQGTSVMNYADLEHPYTRIHEFKHYHSHKKINDQTVIFKEYSVDWDSDKDEYYPVNTNEDIDLLKQYQKEGYYNKKIYFGGRLGMYKYLNMDAAMLSALQLFDCFRKDLEG